jgi:uncharacterized protein YbbK (DUF523 family)
MSEADDLRGRPPVYLVSSCLLGLATRYDGNSKPSAACQQELAGKILIPICPEQLGGLSTPRTPADLTGGQGDDVLVGAARVVNRDGVDVTEQFLRGARMVLEIAEIQQVSGAYLKSGSPSCGSGEVLGVTAALLKSRGIPVREF